MPLFKEKAEELTALTKEIKRLDFELDEPVFDLQRFTEEEKKIISRQ